MKKTNFYTRRDFLKTSGKFAGLLALSPYAPGFLNSPLLAQGTKPDKDKRIFILIQLAGGNDGLNTCVPFQNDDYYKLRPNLAIKAKDCLKINDDMGFHPAFAKMQELFNEGKLSVIQNVGYPNPNRSHFRSTEIWESASFDKYDGWLGRYLDNACQGSPKEDAKNTKVRDPAALYFSNEVPQSFDSENVHNVFGINNPRMLNNMRRSGVGNLRKELLDAEFDAKSGFLRQAMLDEINTEKKLGSIVNAFRPKQNFPQTKLGQSLKNIVAMIHSDLPTRLYFAKIGGFDTHANQAGRHNQLLSELSDALKAMQAELMHHKLDEKVVCMTFSEFGRRPRENSSAGTDHGAAAPLFVVGSQIKGGVIGAPPNLKIGDNKDIKHEIDFRQIYATVIDNWLTCKHESILGAKYNTLGFI